MSHCSILEINVGSDKLWKPGYCMRIRVQFSLKKKEMKSENQIRDGPSYK